MFKGSENLRWFLLFFFFFLRSYCRSKTRYVATRARIYRTGRINNPAIACSSTSGKQIQCYYSYAHVFLIERFFNSQCYYAIIWTEHYTHARAHHMAKSTIYSVGTAFSTRKKNNRENKNIYCYFVFVLFCFLLLF